MTDSETNREIDQLISSRLRSAADAFDVAFDDTDVVFEKSRRQEIENVSWRRFSTVAALTAATVVAVVFTKPFVGRPVETGIVERSAVGSSIEQDLAAVEKRIEMLAEHEAALAETIRELEAQIEEQRIAAMRLNNELTRQRAFATLRAVEEISEGLIPDDVRVSLRQLSVDNTIAKPQTEL